MRKWLTQRLKNWLWPELEEDEKAKILKANEVAFVKAKKRVFGAGLETVLKYVKDIERYPRESISKKEVIATIKDIALETFAAHEEMKEQYFQRVSEMKVKNSEPWRIGEKDEKKKQLGAI